MRNSLFGALCDSGWIGYQATVGGGGKSSSLVCSYKPETKLPSHHSSLIIRGKRAWELRHWSDSGGDTY